MLTLILGSSNSGKSAYAEKLIVAEARSNNRYYIATMEVSDEEARQRVLRHQKLREGKDFITIEETLDVTKCIKLMSEANKSFVLIECSSNLLANLIFTKKMDNDSAVLEAFKQIERLSETVGELYVVGNHYEKNSEYDTETVEYIKALDRLNELLEKVSGRCIRMGNIAQRDFFENRGCEYFPCHDLEEPFNCLFCYCPMYFLDKCPGKPEFREKDGRTIKVCTNCTYPHKRENYKNIMAVLKKAIKG